MFACATRVNCDNWVTLSTKIKVSQQRRLTAIIRREMMHTCPERARISLGEATRGVGRGTWTRGKRARGRDSYWYSCGAFIPSHKNAVHSLGRYSRRPSNSACRGNEIVGSPKALHQSRRPFSAVHAESAPDSQYPPMLWITLCITPKTKPIFPTIFATANLFA